MANYGINRLLGHGIEKDQKDGKKYLLNAMEEDIPVAYYNYAMNLLSIEKARKETAKAYLEYASSRGFKIADVALKDWF